MPNGLVLGGLVWGNEETGNVGDKVVRFTRHLSDFPVFTCASSCFDVTSLCSVSCFISCSCSVPVFLCGCSLSGRWRVNLFVGWFRCYWVVGWMRVSNLCEDCGVKVSGHHHSPRLSLFGLILIVCVCNGLGSSSLSVMDSSLCLIESSPCRCMT